MTSPLVMLSPNGRRVSIRIVTFEACSGFTRVTAHRIAQPPKVTFVTRLQPSRLPSQAARQLPDLSTIIRVDSSSTGDSRPRGALPLSDTLLRCVARARSREALLGTNVRRRPRRAHRRRPQPTGLGPAGHRRGAGRTFRSRPDDPKRGGHGAGPDPATRPRPAHRRARARRPARRARGAGALQSPRCRRARSPGAGRTPPGRPPPAR